MGILKAGVGIPLKMGKGALEFGMKHPKIAIGAAALAGARVALGKDAITPYVQNTFLGAPNAIGAITSGYLSGGMRNYQGSDMASSQYAYGRNIAGAELDQIAGARLLGGYNLSGNARPTESNPNPSAVRVRGSGRDAGRTDGSIVFGMYNTR